MELKIEKEHLPVTLTGGQMVEKAVLLPVLMTLFPGLVRLTCLTEFSVIELKPGQAIGWHTHTEDSEWWIIISTKGIMPKFCRRGSGHEWRNNTGEAEYIIALKWLVPKKKWVTAKGPPAPAKVWAGFILKK